MTVSRIFGGVSSRATWLLAVSFGCVSSIAPRALAQDSTEVLNAAANSIPKTEATVPRARVLSLKRCLELAALNYPKVQEARARLAQKQAQLDQSYSPRTATSR